MKNHETKFETATIYWNTEFDFSFENGEEKEIEFVLFGLVYCAPEGRGNGYAKKALRLAIEDAKATYPELPIRLVVEPKEDDIDAEGLIRLYESVGFSIIEASDVIVMEYKF